MCVHVYTCTMIYVRLGQLSPLFHHMSPSCLFLMSHLASPLIYLLTVFLFVCLCVLSVYQCADPCTCLGGKGADWHALRYCCPPQFWDRISIPFCCDESLWPGSSLWRKGLFHLPAYHPSRKAKRGGTRQELETDLWGNTDYWLPHKLAFGLMVRFCI